MFKLVVAVAGFLQFAQSHFSVEYPPWRADSFEEPGDQWVWPCANISQENSANNRTTWPLTGGSVNLTVHHEWAPTYINIGIGNEVVAFENPLVPLFNQTGNGTFCLREAGRAVLAELGVEEGTNATLQFVQISTNGNALYNCADITFRADAQLLAEDQCTNSTNVGGIALVNADTVAMPSGTGAGSANSHSSTGGATSLSASSLLLLATALFATVMAA